jgi:hypothetical protein
MARVRYIGAEPVTVPELGKTVHPDELVEVPDDRFDGYVCQPRTWEAVEEPKTALKKSTPAAKPASTSKEG